MKEKFLPIGTIVSLKGSNKKLMITEYLVFSKKEKGAKIYDYGSCPFPTGVKKEVSIGFNHGSIEEVVYMGYVDDEQKELSKFLLDNEEKIRKEIQDKLSSK